MWTTWVGAALAIALWDWLAVALDRRRMGYFTKPAVIVALLAAVLTGISRLGHPAMALSWAAVALLFSLVGDVLLMLPKERFVGGLAAFLLAHLAYLVAFSNGLPPFNLWTAGIAVAVGLLAGKFYERLRAALVTQGKSFLIKPIAAYTAAISLMVLAALLLPLRGHTPSAAALTVAAGAVLFLASDALLAWDRFVRPLPRTKVLRRSLYHLGQMAITVGLLLLSNVPLA